MEASRDALVRLSASFWEPFRTHFRCVFKNRPHVDFDDLSHAKAMIYGSGRHPFLYFSVVFFTMRFWNAFFVDVVDF